MRILSLVPALFPLAAAAADCPVAADLDHGIRFTANGGADVEDQMRQGKAVRFLYTGTDGRVGGTVAFGLYQTATWTVKSSGGLDPDNWARYVFSLPATGFPDPSAGGVTTLTVETTDANTSWTEQIRYEFGAPRPVTIGGCGYTGIAVDIFYLASDPIWHERRLYLSELGTSVAVLVGERGAEKSYPLETIERLQ
jgi:hypothetical protein